MFRKTISAILTMIIALSISGATQVFGTTAYAAQYDSYEYSPIPGFTVFTDEELALMQNRDVSAGVNETIGETDVVSWTVSQINFDKTAFIFTGYCRNAASLEGVGPIWGACDTINGKTIVTGTSFEGKDGVCFKAFLNGEPYAGGLQISVCQSPCAGVFLNSPDQIDNDGDSTFDELKAAGSGFCFQSRGVTADEDCVFRFNFNTDFFQVDWWSTDDEGVSHTEAIEGKPFDYYPISEANIAKISRINIIISYNDLSVGDKISIGDMNALFDTEIHTEKLRAQTDAFDALEERAYTAESYSDAAVLRGRADEVFASPDSFTQSQVDSLTRALKAAIASLKPMFLIKDKSILIAGFDWDEDQLDEMAAGGLCTDNSALDADTLPPDADIAIVVVANPNAGDTDGWNRFTNAVENDGILTAIGDPFAVYDGDLTTSDGIRFWIKLDLEDGNAPPSEIRVGLGSTQDGTYYECASCTVPDGEGYIGVPWSAFKSADDKADIHGSIGSLDYISIMMKDYSGVYYLSDLHAAVWSIAPANLDQLRQCISDYKAYMETLNASEYSPRAWSRALNAIAAGEALFDTYGVTDAECEAAIKSIREAVNRLVIVNPSIKKGDADYDGEITVADALTVLRWAAGLEGYVDFYPYLRVADIDLDSKITVSDALSILRVAAKLADESSLTQE